MAKFRSNWMGTELGQTAMWTAALIALNRQQNKKIKEKQQYFNFFPGTKPEKSPVKHGWWKESIDRNEFEEMWGEPLQHSNSYMPGPGDLVKFNQDIEVFGLSNVRRRFIPSGSTGVVQSLDDDGTFTVTIGTDVGDVSLQGQKINKISLEKVTPIGMNVDDLGKSPPEDGLEDLYKNSWWSPSNR